MILSGKGSITIGRSVHGAVVKSLFVEESAQLLYKAWLIGEPAYVARENQQRRAIADEQEFPRAWDYYRSGVLNLEDGGAL